MRAHVYERKPLDMKERLIAQSTANSIKAKIMQYFEQFPEGKIAPSEFKKLMGLKNPIHSVRPRFTELETDLYLQATIEKVESECGGMECRYIKLSDGGQLRCL